MTDEITARKVAGALASGGGRLATHRDGLSLSQKAIAKMIKPNDSKKRDRVDIATLNGR